MPSDVLARLRAGNDRFASGRPLERDLLEQATATAAGQNPYAAVLSCIDSRVPVEIVLDVGLGEVFVARSAGNVVDDDVIGGFEFATEIVGVKLIVVLGHTGCGAVAGACDGVELGHLTQLLAKIQPAVDAEAGDDPSPGSSDAEFARRVVERNTANSVRTLTEQSELLAARVAAGDLMIVAGVYHLASGRITWDAETTDD